MNPELYQRFQIHVIIKHNTYILVMTNKFKLRTIMSNYPIIFKLHNSVNDLFLLNYWYIIIYLIHLVLILSCIFNHLDLHFITYFSFNFCCTISLKFQLKKKEIPWQVIRKYKYYFIPFGPNNKILDSQTD